MPRPDRQLTVPAAADVVARVLAGERGTRCFPCCPCHERPGRRSSTRHHESDGPWMHEVYSFAILIAALGDENAAVVRRRRPSLVRESPQRCLARGPRVPLIAAVSARVCVLQMRALRTTPVGGRPKEGSAVEVLFERVAGLDIGKKTLTVCVRTPGPRGGRRAETRTFSTMTRSLQVMRDWLIECGVTHAAMESTSTYWKGAFYCLEEVMEVWLVNAAHIKAISRRKTDVKDAEWIAQLLEHGLLRPSFVPPPEIRRLRMLTRYRLQLMGDRTREITRLELMLEDASIKLSSVAASLTSVSARAMLGALISGESDPQVLADLAKNSFQNDG